jgi:hypothetical protein
VRARHFGRREQFGVRVDEIEARFAERDQPVVRRDSRTERRLPADERFLQACLVLAEDGGCERGARAEASEQRALADARGFGDLGWMTGRSRIWCLHPIAYGHKRTTVRLCATLWTELNGLRSGI